MPPGLPISAGDWTLERAARGGYALHHDAVMLRFDDVRRGDGSDLELLRDDAIVATVSEPRVPPAVRDPLNYLVAPPEARR